MPSRPVPKSFLGNGTPRCPGLVGWTDMWWLPLGPCSAQPSASNRLINARATRRRGHTHWSSVLDWSGVVVVARSRAPCITWKQTRPAPTPRERLRVQQPVPAGWRSRMASLDRTPKVTHPAPYPHHDPVYGYPCRPVVALQRARSARDVVQVFGHTSPRRTSRGPRLIGITQTFVVARGIPAYGIVI